MLKRCPRCGVERPVLDFARDKSKASGHKSICRACDNAKARRYYEANHDDKLAKQNAYNRVRAALKPRRKCARCGGPATSQRHHYCKPCREIMAKRPGRKNTRGYDPRTSTQRGYGTRHQRLRQTWAAAVEAGRVFCAREDCGRLIEPGEEWDLGHDDNDRSKYTGPEHRACNRATAGRRKRKRW